MTPGTKSTDPFGKEALALKEGEAAVLFFHGGADGAVFFVNIQFGRKFADAREGTATLAERVAAGVYRSASVYSQAYIGNPIYTPPNLLSKDESHRPKRIEGGTMAFPEGHVFPPPPPPDVPAAALVYRNSGPDSYTVAVEKMYNGPAVAPAELTAEAFASLPKYQDHRRGTPRSPDAASVSG